MIAWLASTSLGRNALAIGGVIAGVLAALSYARWTGGQSARRTLRDRAARAERATHERMNHADDDPGADDAANRRYMRELANSLRSR